MMQKRNVPLLFLLLFLCTACLPKSSAIPASINYSVIDAIEDGFPVYLPASNVLKSLGIVNSPIITLETKDKDCKHLSIIFYRETVPYDQENVPVLKILITEESRCLYPEGWRGYITTLSWAVGGKATRVGEDYINELPPVILFQEPSQYFLYVAYSLESFENTMMLLESMQLIGIEKQ